MANVSTAFKRSFVRRAFRQSVTDGDAFLTTLESLEDARIDTAKSGKILVATSGNGHQNSFQLPQDFNTTDAVELVSEIIDRYTEARAWLVSEDDIDSPTDTQIKDQMLADLVAARSMAYDISGLRQDREEQTS